MKNLVVVMLTVLCVAGSSSAAVYWNNGAGGLWSEAANWNGGVPATDADSANVRAAEMGNVAGSDYLGPTIEAGIDAVARQLVFEVGVANSITMTMTGGSLTMTRGGGTTNYLRLGAGGSTGTAILNMSGGVITIDSNDDVYVKGSNDYIRVGYGYGAELNLSGDAQIFARDILLDCVTGTVDLSDTASIVLKGDDTGEIADFIANGGFTSNGGANIGVAYSYDQGTDLTTITAIPEPATMLLLGLGGLVLCRKKN